MPLLLLYRQQRTWPTHLIWTYFWATFWHIVSWGSKCHMALEKRQCNQYTITVRDRQTRLPLCVRMCVCVYRANLPSSLPTQNSKHVRVRQRHSVGPLVQEVCNCAWFQSEHISTTSVCLSVCYVVSVSLLYPHIMAYNFHSHNASFSLSLDPPVPPFCPTLLSIWLKE